MLKFLYKILCLITILFLIVAISIACMGFRIGIVKSSSMAPQIAYGSMVVWASPSEVKCGDIVAYKYNANIEVHRVVEIDNDILVTRGDSEHGVEREVSKDKILGKVVFYSYFGGVLIDILKFCLPICIFFAIFMKIFWKKILTN